MIARKIDSAKDKPWGKWPYSNVTPPGEGMLMLEEAQLLYWATHNYFSNQGAIIDAGCFLGGSTNALGQGLVDAGKHGVIDSYDLFQAGEFDSEAYGAGRFKPGDSFWPVFMNNTYAVRDFLRVHHDITERPWRGGPIEIFFYDCGKTPEVNDHVIQNMFPWLIPNVSLLIQEDYLHKWLPWLHVTMEALSDCFERVGDTGINSAVYGCVKTPTPEAIEKALWRNMTWDRRVELMNRVEASWELPQRDWVTQAKECLLDLRSQELRAAE